jgi:hypothetical protein
MKRRKYFIALVVTVLAALFSIIILDRYCPPSGLALTTARRNVHRLKNRTSFPHSSDFDLQATLPALLQPGDDQNRWNQSRAARVEGYVVSIGRAGVELANCYSPCRRDIHINLALRTDALESEQVVVEVTPNFERWARNQGLDWSAETLKRTLVGRWCRVEGWLFYDREHAQESRNTSEEGEDLWRATAWEVHPVTKIEVVR